MNNSSSWGCFSRNRERGNATSESEKKGSIKHLRDISDEQFANLLGGEFFFFNIL
jgi:hypothetical protein